MIVRRRDIEGESRPHGGGFTSVALPRFPVPRWISQSFGIFCADTAERVVCLSYDDGPSPEHTPALLDELASRGATATFFVLGQQVEQHPTLARRIKAEGHEVALHGYDHRSLLTLSDREGVECVRRAKDSVEQLLSTPVRLYRPPYGAHTVRQARGIARLGLDLVIWSVDSRDWSSGSEVEVVDRVSGGLFPGAIVLLHDHRGDPETIPPASLTPALDRTAILRRLLDHCEDVEYRTVTTGELLSRHQPVRSWARERMVRS